MRVVFQSLGAFVSYQESLLVYCMFYASGTDEISSYLSFCIPFVLSLQYQTKPLNVLYRTFSMTF